MEPFLTTSAAERAAEKEKRRSPRAELLLAMIREPARVGVVFSTHVTADWTWRDGQVSNRRDLRAP
jgi:hypothetical protein